MGSLSIFSFLALSVGLAIAPHPNSLQWPLGNRPAALQTSTAWKVPGENPLNFCADPATYLFQVHAVNLEPNPPVPGQNLTVTAGGTLSEAVDEGSAHLTVKLSFIKLIDQTMDLCDVAERSERKCPLEKGALNLTKIIQIPGIVPAGKYHVKADVYTQDHDQTITCVEGEVEF